MKVRNVREGKTEGSVCVWGEVSKERLLALLKIMFENTDDEQGLTLEQILEELRQRAYPQSARPCIAISRR